MRDADRYAKIVQWSDEDNCFVGTIPDLCRGGCHGPDPRAVFDELCQIAEEWVEILMADGTPLPVPTDFVVSDAAANTAARRFVGSDKRPGDVARNSKRLLRGK